jgi:hypothetical protein
MSRRTEYFLYQHQGKEGKSRGIRFCKIPSEASVSSVTSDIPPNQTRINVDDCDDITDDTNKISSEKSAQNHAQNGNSDASDNTDDTFHITSPSFALILVIIVAIAKQTMKKSISVM